MHDADAALWKHLALVFDAFGHGILRGLTIAGVVLVLLIGRRRAALFAFALAEALTPLLVNVIKLLIGRERPPAAMIDAHGSSYPSGHAAYAGATAVMLVLLFIPPGRLRRAGWVVAALLTAGMAWSRTYLQVHWLTDSVAGAMLGVGVALLSLAAVQILSERARARGRSAAKADLGERTSIVVEVLVVERLEQAVPRREVVQAAAHLDEHHVDACWFSSLSSCSSTSAAVTSTSVIASHCTTTQRPPLPDQAADLLAELACVREKQRRLPAEYDDAGDLRGFGYASTLCHPSRPSTVPRTTPCGHQFRRKNSRIGQDDGDDDALEHAEEDHPGRGSEGEHEGLLRTGQ